MPEGGGATLRFRVDRNRVTLINGSEAASYGGLGWRQAYALRGVRLVYRRSRPESTLAVTSGGRHTGCGRLASE